jgi:hypothetical protein
MVRACVSVGVLAVSVVALHFPRIPAQRYPRPMRDDEPVPVQDDVCPRCGGPLFRPALSRYDNASSVCESCGVLEALWCADHKQVEAPGWDVPLTASPRR